MRTKLWTLLRSLSDKAYRSTFVETEIETLIPFQIRAMRAHRGWSQKELARQADTTQARISVLENPNHEGGVNVKTLVKLAAAFDVALVVRFAPFTELAEWSSRLSRDNHDVPDFAKEIAALEADSGGSSTSYTTNLRLVIGAADDTLRTVSQGSQRVAA